MTVSQMAWRTGHSAHKTSESLRLLNARGLLRVRRRGRHVYYRIGGDPSVPDSEGLLKVILPALASRAGAAKQAYKLLTAFTHPRRVRITRELSRQSMTLSEIRERIDCSMPAAVRHVRKLLSRGMIKRTKDKYALARPRDRIRRALLQLAIQSPPE